MSDVDVKKSDLVEIAKRNGEFRKNYGVFLGACLYVFSIKAAQGGLSWWKALLGAAVAAAACWLKVRTGY